MKGKGTDKSSRGSKRGRSVKNFQIFWFETTFLEQNSTPIAKIRQKIKNNQVGQPAVVLTQVSSLSQSQQASGKTLPKKSKKTIFADYFLELWDFI